MDELIDIARRQGYITTREAMALGAHEHTLGRLADAGLLERGARGTFLLPSDRYLSDAHALLTKSQLDRDPFAAASHHSALALHGIALHGVAWGQVHVLDPRKTSSVHRSIHRHVRRPTDRFTQVDGYPVATLPLALAQVAARFGVTAGVVSLDHALHLDRCTTDDVSEILALGRLRRGLTFVRRALDLADGRAQSPGESRLRCILADAPWSIESQVNVDGPGSGYELDLLVAGRVAVEFDGDCKYQGPEGHRAVIDEKRREDAIRDMGFGVARFTWTELDYPVAVRRTIQRRVLATPPLRPEVIADLTRRNLTWEAPPDALRLSGS